MHVSLQIEEDESFTTDWEHRASETRRPWWHGPSSTSFRALVLQPWAKKKTFKTHCVSMAGPHRAWIFCVGLPGLICCCWAVYERFPTRRCGLSSGSGSIHELIHGLIDGSILTPVLITERYQRRLWRLIKAIPVIKIALCGISGFQIWPQSCRSVDCL